MKRQSKKGNGKVCSGRRARVARGQNCSQNRPRPQYSYIYLDISGKTVRSWRKSQDEAKIQHRSSRVTEPRQWHTTNVTAPKTGCLLCKPWKMNGFGKFRPEAAPFSDHHRRSNVEWQSDENAKLSSKNYDYAQRSRNGSRRLRSF